MRQSRSQSVSLVCVSTVSASAHNEINSVKCKQTKANSQDQATIRDFNSESGLAVSVDSLFYVLNQSGSAVVFSWKPSSPRIFSNSDWLIQNYSKCPFSAILGLGSSKILFASGINYLKVYLAQFPFTKISDFLIFLDNDPMDHSDLIVPTSHSSLYLLSFVVYTYNESFSHRFISSFPRNCQGGNMLYVHCLPQFSFPICIFITFNL